MSVFRQVEFDFDDLNITTHEMDLSELEGDMAQFRQHPVIREAVQEVRTKAAWGDL